MAAAGSARSNHTLIRHNSITLGMVAACAETGSLEHLKIAWPVLRASYYGHFCAYPVKMQSDFTRHVDIIRTACSCKITTYQFKQYALLKSILSILLRAIVIACELATQSALTFTHCTLQRVWLSQVKLNFVVIRVEYAEGSQLRSASCGQHYTTVSFPTVQSVSYYGRAVDPEEWFPHRMLPGGDVLSSLKREIFSRRARLSACMRL
eukprot:6177658-Pleurochrysis_carterae.AAC.2